MKGVEVVPFSHLEDATERVRLKHPQYSRRPSDFCVLRIEGTSTPPPILLKAKAGDLILWDSRLIHGGKVGPGKSRGHEDERTAAYDFARLALPVCMSPRNFAPALVQEKRRKGFTTGNTYTHWPHEAVCTNLSSSGFVPVELSDRTLELI